MKKRLLITSIVMMLVVAVALSTATYAWFTSNAAVTASSITLTAESNAGASIGIAWGTDELASAITAQGPAEGAKFAPMAPATCEEGVTAVGVQFQTATIKSSAGEYVFNGPTNTSAFAYQSASNQTFFRVANTSSSNNASVQMALTGATDSADLLRIGVFTSATSDGAYKLAKVLSVTAGEEVAYGTIVSGNAVDELVADGQEYETASTYTFPLANLTTGTGSVLYFKVIVWMDGYALNDATASSVGTFGFSFTATKA